MKLLIINIGGSSTKLAIYEDEKEIITEVIRHPESDFKEFDSIWSQYEYRKNVVEEFLKRNQTTLSDLQAIVSRGPVVKPLHSGVYYISKEMVDDAQSGNYGMHPSGLGCKIALEMSEGKIPCLTVDPPCVDEMIDIARITGLPQIKRVSFFQALNHKAKAKQLAKELGKKYEDLNLVITHLGSGISVGTHRKGQVIDITNGLEGDGPFGLDRVGTLPAGDWMRYCLSGEKTKDELKNIINGGGGILAHLKVRNAIEVEKMIEDGDEHAALIFHALAFQVGKGVGAASAALGAKPDGIIVTGGLAYSKRFIDHLMPMIEWMAPVYIWPDDNEIESLAFGALRGLKGIETIYSY
ncbi:butyrate kinase [Otariodibacter sp.]|uniref:butyrate kinase n=1 Tax=Otariodibacter sp. TaxID=3030919 RepID=UPI00261CFDFC|nr:butyrate kinase [Otariodibacter sp.]